MKHLNKASFNKCLTLPSFSADEQTNATHSVLALSGTLSYMTHQILQQHLTLNKLGSILYCCMNQFQAPHCNVFFKHFFLLLLTLCRSPTLSMSEKFNTLGFSFFFEKNFAHINMKSLCLSKNYFLIAALMNAVSSLRLLLYLVCHLPYKMCNPPFVLWVLNCYLVLYLQGKEHSMVHSPYLGYFKEDQTDDNLNSAQTPAGN